MALGLGVSLLAAACTQAGDEEGNGDQDTLVVVLDSVAEGINPDGAAASATSSVHAQGLLHDTLLYYETEEQDGVLVPDYSSFEGRLAESWSQDGLTWTFKLREGVLSCAGNEMTADDVIYSWARAKSVSGATPVTWFLGNVSGILPLDPLLEDATEEDKELRDTEVMKVDDYTVQFTQSAPNALFPLVLTISYLAVFDSAEMEQHATEEDPWSHAFTDSEGAAGFGEYCLEEWAPGERMTLQTNPEYYRGQPQFTTVILRQVPEPASRVAAIRTGEADVAIGLTPREYGELSEAPDVDVLGWFSNESVHLTPNYNFPPWNQPEGKLIRQAIAYAIPYDDIISEVFFGKADRYHSHVPPGYSGQKDNPIYETDIEQARQLLAEAGYPDGEGLESFEEGFSLAYPVERRAYLEPMALRIQTALAEIGIPLSLNPISDSDFTARVLTTRDIPLGLDDHEHPIGPDAAYTAQLYFVSAEMGGLSNSVNYSSPTVDELWGQALNMSLGSERDEILGDLQDQLMEDLPWIPIVLRKSEIAVRSGIVGWEGNPDTTVNFWSLGFEER